MNYKNNLIYFVAIIFMVSGCNTGPKVIESTMDETEEKAETNPEVNMGHNFAIPEQNSTGEIHTVVVKEVLPASKYAYLRVSEGEEEYWIATAPREISVDETYYYKSRLVQRNLKSSELDRTFDEIYFVSNMISQSHSMDAHANVEPETISRTTKSKDIDQEGSIKISDLVSNKEKYENQTVQLTGECVKINANIMGRNWIHLKDGSMDEYDLVVTSDVSPKVGEIITLTGKVTLNKDFGAGYRYQLIVEDGESVDM